MNGAIAVTIIIITIIKINWPINLDQKDQEQMPNPKRSISGSIWAELSPALKPLNRANRAGGGGVYPAIWKKAARISGIRYLLCQTKHRFLKQPSKSKNTNQQSREDTGLSHYTSQSAAFPLSSTGIEKEQGRKELSGSPHKALQCWDAFKQQRCLPILKRTLKEKPGGHSAQEESWQSIGGV